VAKNVHPGNQQGIVMTRERDEHAGKLYRAALELPAEQRPAFLATACGRDEELKRQVESLLGESRWINQQVDHYQILCLLGKGGMGEVYLAEDTKLGRKVAIKILPVQSTWNTDRLRRFEREARTASALNHPNIITILGIGQVSDTRYIATEFVEGETLRAMLRGGKLKRSSVADVAAQVASALAAAHRAGIVHRDIKPENIMVRPDGYVKVLDFGIAKLTERPTVTIDSPTLTLTTECGSVMGTPHYMSPEQVRGDELDGRADLFSLGVVLYEMLTGGLPFQGSTTAMVFDAILHQTPKFVGVSGPELPAGFVRVVNRALEKDRELRYQAASEMRADLEKLKRQQDSNETTGRTLEKIGTLNALLVQQKSRRWRFALALGLLFVLLTGTMSYFLKYRPGLEQSAASSKAGQRIVSSRSRRSVAVFGFKNVSDRVDARWLSTALTEMLTTELVVGDRLRAIPAENVTRSKIELGLPNVLAELQPNGSPSVARVDPAGLAAADMFSRETLERIRRNLGADLVLLGSYLAQGQKAGDKLRLDLRVQDTVSGETIVSVSEDGSETELSELVSRAGARLREKLGLNELSAVEKVAARTSLPSNAVAARFYAEGLAKLRLFDALGARDLLEKAIAAQPDYPLAHFALADAWSLLGYDEKATAAAKDAFDLSATLLQEERLSVEARYREITNEWKLAVELYSRLQGFYPDNLEYGLRLADAQTAFGQGRESLVTVEALRRLAPPASEDLRIDLTEAEAARSLADYRRQQAAANRAAAKAKQNGARLLLADARLVEGGAFRSLGEAEKAKAAFEEARAIYSTAGDQRGVGESIYSLAATLHEQGDVARAKKLYTDALAIDLQTGNKRGIAKKKQLIGNVLYDQGDYPEARVYYEQSLQMSREIGDKAGMAVSLNSIGNSIYSLDLPQARKRFEDSAAIYREIGDRSGLARAVNNIAAVLEDLKDLEGARKNYAEAMDLFEQGGDKAGAAGAAMNVGEILYYQGRLTEAQRLLEEAVTATREVGKKSWVAHALIRVAEVLQAEGKLGEARAKDQEALAIRQELGEKEAIGESWVALGQLSVEEGQPEKALIAARQATEIFRTLKGVLADASAQNVAAQALLAQGKIAEARLAINEAMALVTKGHDLDAKFPIAITAGRVSAASAQFSEARKILNSTFADASRYGYLGYVLESRLALAEIGLKSGNAASSRVALAALQTEAMAKGYALIARKAATANK
jgi:serine/threonine protein kinase/Tfp pilus assembly protein PilF